MTCWFEPLILKVGARLITSYDVIPITSTDGGANVFGDCAQSHDDWIRGQHRPQGSG
jgi:hypothetical protein